jgi:peptidyl-prolyl cis-trans isomerase SurA
MEETVDKSSNKYKLSWIENQPNEIMKNEEVGGYSFQIIKKIIPVRTKMLKEARGYVVAEYQDYLEKEWLEKLSNEYKIEVNQIALSQLIKK